MEALKPTENNATNWTLRDQLRLAHQSLSKTNESLFQLFSSGNYLPNIQVDNIVEDLAVSAIEWLMLNRVNAVEGKGWAQSLEELSRTSQLSTRSRQAILPHFINSNEFLGPSRTVPLAEDRAALSSRLNQLLTRAEMHVAPPLMPEADQSRRTHLSAAGKDGRFTLSYLRSTNKKQTSAALGSHSRDYLPHLTISKVPASPSR